MSNLTTLPADESPPTVDDLQRRLDVSLARQQHLADLVEQATINWARATYLLSLVYPGDDPDQNEPPRVKYDELTDWLDRVGYGQTAEIFDRWARRTPDFRSLVEHNFIQWI